MEHHQRLDDEAVKSVIVRGHVREVRLRVLQQRFTNNKIGLEVVRFVLQSPGRLFMLVPKLSSSQRSLLPGDSTRRLPQKSFLINAAWKRAGCLISDSS